jgi:hypothetical protein
VSTLYVQTDDETDKIAKIALEWSGLFTEKGLEIYHLVEVQA